MLSGIAAAEQVAAALAAGSLSRRTRALRRKLAQFGDRKDLRRVRNVKPLWSKFGTLRGVAMGGMDMWANTLGLTIFGTLRHGKPDNATLEPASQFKPIQYPKPDGKLTFDRLSSVFLSNTNHEENQPAHLHIADVETQRASEHDIFGGPSGRYCPAGVYGVDRSGGGSKIRRQCVRTVVHCRPATIKDPNGNITWVPPEGGGGPNYPDM